MLIGLFVLDVKHLGLQGHITVEFVKDVLGEWTIIVLGLITV